MTDSQTIVISDLKKCLNCGNCIAACKNRHKDVSRHVRERSAIIGSSLIPNLCKICMNPKCIEACNRHGIERDDDGHIIVTDDCVGCGLCVMACPYGAIHFFTKQEEYEPSLMDKILSFIKPQKEDDTVINRKEGTSAISKVEGIIDKFPKVPGSLMGILQGIQDEYKYLPREALVAVSEKMGIPFSRVCNVATFYNAFSLIPRGRHIIHVCRGTACHVRGSEKVLGELERVLGVKSGETTKDMKFTLESVNCLGACALGPVMVIDGEYFGKVTPEKVDSILKTFD